MREPLVDGHGRSIGDVRISVTDRCNFRCQYCMPAEGLPWLNKQSLLSYEEMTRLVSLLAEGCQSELEIWGCLHVLRAQGMPAFVQQRRVSVGAETFVLDAACEESMLAVEMDGAAWHGSRARREADIRRDSLLATVGWQTLRFSYSRMTGSPEACRRDIRAVHDGRLRLLRGDAVR